MSPFLKHVFEEIPLFLIFALGSFNELFIVIVTLEDLAHAQTIPTKTMNFRGTFKMAAGPGPACFRKSPHFSWYHTE